MHVLSFLETHRLAHGNLNLMNIWVSQAGKIMIGVYSVSGFVSRLSSSIAEPEVCRRSDDDAEINCLRDVKDVGNIMMTLMTKSNDSERSLDTERYSSRLVDFLRRTSTESARGLEHVCLLPLPTYIFRTYQLIYRSTVF
jgi:hypothetical protein